jgi:hypothetical protein
MSAPPQYRVEHHQAGRSSVLAAAAAATPHHSLLAPFASRLLHEGGTGTVLLVDETTGEVVARRRVQPPGRAKPPAAAATREPGRTPADRTLPLLVLGGRSPGVAAHALRTLAASRVHRAPGRVPRPPQASPPLPWSSSSPTMPSWVGP